VLVMQQLKRWRASHGGEVPKGKAEQDQFRAEIRALRRNTEEENFEEALTNAFHSWVPIPIPGDVKKILADPKTNITAESHPFWIVARAMKEFVANEGRGNLPVNGSIPDMTANTKSYVALQRIYRDKAAADVDAVYAHVQALLKSIGRDGNSIAKDYVALSCKNAFFWKLMRYRTISEEFTAPNANSISLSLGMLKELDGDCMPLYVMLRATDKFRDVEGRYPGDGEDLDEMHRNYKR